MATKHLRSVEEKFCTFLLVFLISFLFDLLIWRMFNHLAAALGVQLYRGASPQRRSVIIEVRCEAMCSPIFMHGTTLVMTCCGLLLTAPALQLCLPPRKRNFLDAPAAATNTKNKT